ncbi:MAG TPA: helix-turn-helix transcriptional regulator [Flavobacteriales bacterium]|nr:helix-turn-helix transcriptional regulator [Flavobacteriales bacterium]
MIAEPLGKFVASRRKSLKLTQQELAAKAGVGLRFIRELEGGKATLRMDKVNDVLHLFGHQLVPGPLSNDHAQPPQP